MPNAKIIAVEADPYIYERLQNNVALNDNFINIVPAGLSDEDGHINLHINTQNRGESSILSQAETNVGAVNVKAIRLTTLLDSHNVQTPNIMKLDLEGAEHIVLSTFFRDAPQQRHPDMVTIENESKEANTSRDQALSTLFKNNGYSLQSKTSNNCIFVCGRK